MFNPSLEIVASAVNITRSAEDVKRNLAIKKVERR